ncbi:MAG: phosphate ABC transporter permease PstA [Meiothermus sp.]|uniref:phosphate ABC transporter permease PstA n=1 Tax=Meiothermus sp. TaxID=1955249 RepID=UPI0025DFF1D9|nr:phosphate ABC transporter permease PstA [Meiothermus sp.]MCS7057895.1 phosphate ABC transporter permease PstA [Meiothermus sp.]MCS7194229.1 phosphate ABC transporter permease PstA [Meiothermus sp.]MCX7740481.1 phosphate ABC transporter permease PstA [Meiothermus sp.]MDW8090090.1 phosphate ABC transporter permease PstA [Meiothermus sp.]MDW8480740.1 phosphate ABC transporter permease PstA [Meiothermus sp.]
MRNLQARYARDRVILFVVVIGTILAALPLTLVLFYAVVNGFSSLDWNFFTKGPKPPGETGGGMAPAIVGTLVITGTGLLIATPFGIAAGILMAEYPDNKLNPTLRLLSDTLNGMPAILKGLLAYVLVVKAQGSFSGFSGALAMAFIMVPIIAKSTESMLKLVPWNIREAGLALGLPRWRVILSLVLPAARGGVVTGMLLATARAAGEAAPLIFTAFGNTLLTLNLSQPMDALPLRLYAYAISPYEDWHRLAWAAALVLLALVVLTSLLARWATRGRF